MKILIAEPDAETQARYEEMKGPDDPSRFEDFLKLTDPLAVEKLAYSIIPRLIDHRRLGTHIVNMKWGTVDVRCAKHSLLLSDCPLVTSNGIGNADGHIIMPLNHGFVFYCAVNEQVRSSILSLSRNEIVRRLNRLIVSRARHFVVAKDLRQMEFVKKHFGTAVAESWPEALHRHYLEESVIGSSISH